VEKPKFQSLARHLKRKLPLGVPISIRLRRVPRRRIGDCTSDGTTFLIRVDPSLGTDEACGTLLHEVAHALSWGLDGPDEDHGEFFRHAERTVWSWYLAWLRGE